MAWPKHAYAPKKTQGNIAKTQMQTPRWYPNETEALKTNKGKQQRNIQQPPQKTLPT